MRKVLLIITSALLLVSCEESGLEHGKTPPEKSSPYVFTATASVTGGTVKGYSLSVMPTLTVEVLSGEDCDYTCIYSVDGVEATPIKNVWLNTPRTVNLDVPAKIANHVVSGIVTRWDGQGEPYEFSFEAPVKGTPIESISDISFISSVFSPYKESADEGSVKLPLLDEGVLSFRVSPPEAAVTTFVFSSDALSLDESRLGRNLSSGIVSVPYSAAREGRFVLGYDDGDKKDSVVFDIANHPTVYLAADFMSFDARLTDKSITNGHEMTFTAVFGFGASPSETNIDSLSVDIQDVAFADADGNPVLIVGFSSSEKTFFPEGRFTGTGIYTVTKTSSFVEITVPDPFNPDNPHRPFEPDDPLNPYDPIDLNPEPGRVPILSLDDTFESPLAFVSSIKVTLGLRSKDADGNAVPCFWKLTSSPYTIAAGEVWDQNHNYSVPWNEMTGSYILSPYASCDMLALYGSDSDIQ